MIVFTHENRVRVSDGRFFVDRKYLAGMEHFLRHLGVPIMVVHPELPPEEDGSVIDLIDVPVGSLGYSVITLRYDERGRLAPGEMERLRAATADAKLVYGDVSVLQLGAAWQVPLISVIEYTLKTVVTFATEGVKGGLERNWRLARALRFYLTKFVPSIRRAKLLHCNGYPIYEESALVNNHRLLYLDSRMHRDQVIPEDALASRLANRPKRIPRLLFSGRFEPAKGALDVVLVGVELARRGVPFEMHLYGRGSQRAAMDRAVLENGLAGKVTIHDAVTYPELVEIARGFDLFVCCHVQDDPSCTYIESFGCGLPVVGYANAMWKGLATSSRAGVVSPLRAPAALADSIASLLADAAWFDALSRHARDFAVEHCFENEFARRTDSIEELYRRAA
jgi:glycosyltransferase involved in cell wall biosynthesis